MRTNPAHRIRWLGLLMAAALWPASARAVVTYEEFISLYWKDPGKNHSYVVEIREGDKTVAQKSTNEMTLTVKLPPGKYEYRIKTLDEKGGEGPWSDYHSFTVGIGPITPNTDAFRLNAKGMNLEWEEIKGASGYSVKVTRNGEPYLDKMIEGNSLNVELPDPGKYHFKIAAVHDGVVGDVENEYEYDVTEAVLIEAKNSETGVVTHPISMVELVLAHNVPPRFTWSLGVSTTYVTYQEELDSVHLTELALSTKVNASYTLIPEKLELAANAFATLGSFMSSPATLDPARFVGLNLRIGYRLPIQSETIEWSALTGWYIWNMIVPDGQYGLRQLAGPQLFLLAKSMELGGFAYLKFAPLSEKIGSLNLSNRELAIGGGYKLSTPETYGPWGTLGAWMLTLDLSSTKFTSVTAGNKMSMTSISVGISLGM